VTLFTVITVPPTGSVVSSQTITNRSAFRCVRFLAPTNNPSCNVAEINFYTPDPPPTPMGLTTKPLSGSQIYLSWATSAGATSYKLKRSTLIGGTYATIATGLTNAIFYDTGLNAGTTYYYVVSATAFGVDSPLSAPVAGQPNNIILTNSWDGNQLKLSWPGGGALLEATNVSGPWTTNAGAASPFSIAPGQPQKFYRVRLQ
jgi:hypothetical protein